MELASCHIWFSRLASTEAQNHSHRYLFSHVTPSFITTAGKVGPWSLRYPPVTNSHGDAGRQEVKCLQTASGHYRKFIFVEYSEI